MTSLPRPVLIALVGAAAVAALFVTSRRGGEETATSTPAATEAPKSQSSTPAQSGAGTAPGETTGPAGSQSGQGSSPGASTPRKQARADEARTLPTGVKSALDAHKVVVLLFWNPKGTDDRSVKQAVDSVGTRGGKVAVFSDDLSDVARYISITSPANVTQSPTLVVVDSKGNAQTATGYLDAATVDQYVVDALRKS